SSHAVVRQSDAPNTRNTRRACHAVGTVMSRAYHPMSPLSGTPESGEPHENGTRISRFVGRLSNPNCQRPLRLSHSARWKSGRGCSGRGVAAPWTSARTTPRHVEPRLMVLD